MITTIVIAVLAILGIAAIIIGRRDPKAVVGGAGLLVVAAFLTFLATWTVVGATEVGVPISFGKIGEPLQSGRHFVAPWVKVETYPTRPITVELAGDEKIIARTADAGQMKVEIATRWKVDPAQASAVYMQTRTGDDDKISRDIIEKNLRQAVGEAYTKVKNLDAVNDRTQVTGAIKTRLQESLRPYGITVEDVNLRSVEPDDKTAATIAAFSQQQQATRIAEEATKTATAEAKRRLIEAQGLKKAAKATSGITTGEAQMLCLQAWSQMTAEAIKAGQPIYVSPCGNSGSSMIVNTPAK